MNSHREKKKRGEVDAQGKPIKGGASGDEGEDDGEDDPFSEKAKLRASQAGATDEIKGTSTKAAKAEL